jgi:serine/threonine protein kinase
LSDCLRGQPLPPAEVVRYGIGVADALRHIHDRYVYGCLDPGSILLTETGVALAPVHRAGISPYTAPEQLRGTFDDPRSDIFTLGAILYEMTTGHRAFDSRNADDLRTVILHCEPAPLEGSPLRLARVVAACLEKRPERRFQRAQLLAAQLKLIAATLRNPELRPEPDEEEPAADLGLTILSGYTRTEPALATETVILTEDEIEAVTPSAERMPCPKCHSTDVRPSRPKGPWEHTLEDLGVKFSRCYRCYHRFMRIAFMTVSRDS